MNILSCFMFKRTDALGNLVAHQQCGFTGQWTPTRTAGYPGYQEPQVDGAYVSGAWYNRDNYSVWATNSPSARNAFLASTLWTSGNCDACLY